MPPLVRASLALVVVGVGAAAVWWALPRGGDDPPRRTLLVTGFGPFGGYATNPSWEVARALDGEHIGDLRVVAARLDVTYEDAPAQLAAALAAHAPDVVLSLGVAPTPAIRLERTAINRDRSAQPDNEGVVHEDTPVRADGPATLPSRLPLERMHAALAEAGFPVATSDDAGGYLCNHVFYRLLDELDASKPAGFVHVPPLEAPWNAARLEQAVRRLVEVLGSPSDP